MLLFRYKWIIPTLAEMHPGGGAKFITIINRFGMSRSMLTSTLAHLMDFGFVEKNSRYGHPMRPEYVLTAAGAKVSPFCYEFMSLLRKKNMPHLLQNRWACPIIFHTGNKECRFNEYKRILRPITSKALSESLDFLLKKGSIKKDIIIATPPAPIYTLPKNMIKLCDPFLKYEGELSFS